MKSAYKNNGSTAPADWVSSGNDVLIEEYLIPAGSTWKRTMDRDKIVFIMEGEIILAYMGSECRKLGPLEMFVLPRNGIYQISTSIDMRMIVFCISFGTHISDLFPILPDDITEDVRENSLYSLQIKKNMAEFLNTTITCVQGGVEVVNYYEFKFRELLVLMRRYYSPEELMMLFRAVLKPNSEFIDFVLANYEKAKTVEELADMSHYSLSAFNRYFKSSFGQPPYTWMKHQKAMKLFNTIKNSDDKLQQISDEFGFSSLSQMTNFCKANFQCTPTQIRRDRNMSSIKTDKSDKKTRIVK